VYVATTALHIACVIRSAVSAAKAAALRGSLRQASFIVRLGDEEFAVRVTV
jgi:GGDEF domain-containing protein